MGVQVPLWAFLYLITNYLKIDNRISWIFTSSDLEKGRVNNDREKTPWNVRKDRIPSRNATLSRRIARSITSNSAIPIPEHTSPPCPLDVPPGQRQVPGPTNRSSPGRFAVIPEAGSCLEHLPRDSGTAIPRPIFRGSLPGATANPEAMHRFTQGTVGNTFPLEDGRNQSHLLGDFCHPGNFLASGIDT